MKILIYFLVAIPVLYLGMLLGFYLIQDYLIFRGTKLHADYVYQFTWDYEERNYINKEGLKLNTLLFRTKNSRGVVFYHHGNSEHLQSWGERAAIFLDQGYDVFMYDYRGYGKSEGSIRQERQLHRDAHFLFRELLRQYEQDKIVIYGISLGTGISCKLAARYKVKCLVLETPYYHFFDVIRFHYPFLPVRIISKYRFRTHYYMRKVQSPVYVIHGTKDAVISYESSVKLKERSPHINLVIVEGGEHSNLPDFEEYHLAMRQALQ